MPSLPILLAEMPPELIGGIVIAAGLFSMAGAFFGWDWYINSRKARLWVKLFGVMGARIFYGILGLFMVVMGVLVILGGMADDAPGA